MSSKKYNITKNDKTFRNIKNRSDLSNYLYHWVSAKNEAEAVTKLLSIIIDRYIHGSTRMIKGGYTCICFTETPSKYFDFYTTRYWPLGIRVSKINVFKNGGRQVIYQRDSEYYELPETLKWRHVRYEPDSNPPIDFHWEREWRIKDSAFSLDPKDTSIIVPNDNIATQLEQEFHHFETNRYLCEFAGWGEDQTRYPEPLIYPINILEY